MKILVHKTINVVEITGLNILIDRVNSIPENEQIAIFLFSNIVLLLDTIK